MYELIKKRKLLDATNTEFTENEEQALRDFFDTEIDSQNDAYVDSLIKRMFKDLEPPEFKSIFLDSITIGKVRNFDFLKLLVRWVCKTNREEDKLKMLFKVFTNNKPTMTRAQLDKFIPIFELANDHPLRSHKEFPLKKDFFVE